MSNAMVDYRFFVLRFALGRAPMQAKSTPELTPLLTPITIRRPSVCLGRAQTGPDEQNSFVHKL